MYASNHKLTPKTAVKQLSRFELLNQVKELLKAVNKNPLVFNWEAWKNLRTLNGGIHFTLESITIRYKDEVSRLLVLALAKHLVEFVKTYNGIPAGFLELDSREQKAILTAMKEEPTVSKLDLEHIESLLP